MVGGEQTVWLLQCAFLLILAALLSRVVMGFYHAYTKLFGAARNTLFAHNIIPRALLGVGTGTFGAWFAWQIFRESMHRRMGADVLLRLNPVVLISTVLLGGAWGLLIAYTLASRMKAGNRAMEELGAGMLPIMAPSLLLFFPFISLIFAVLSSRQTRTLFDVYGQSSAQRRAEIGRGLLPG